MRAISLLMALSIFLPVLDGLAQPASVTLIPQASVWKYLDNGSDQGTDWTLRGLNDSTWRSGPAPLGYGDDGEGAGTTISFGPQPTNTFITTYFRRTFKLSTLEGLLALNISLIRDDGAVVYLNGTEIFRDNMPDGPPNYLTLASVVVESETKFGVASTNALVVGTNVIAVEVHQVFPYSSDLEFDLGLTVLKVNASPTVRITKPSDGLRLVDPTNLLISAMATDADGFATIKSVEFFCYGTSIGQLTDVGSNPPNAVLEYTWRNARAGSYLLSAVAMDDAGATTVSDPVRVQVVSESGLCPPPLQWQTGLGDDQSNRLFRIHQAGAGGYLLGGLTFNNAPRFWLVRLGAEGGILWQQTYGTNTADFLADLQPGAGGGYVMAGRAVVGTANTNAEIIRVDEDGNLLWTRTYGGAGADSFSSIRATADGGYIAAGGSSTAAGADKTGLHYGKGDVWVVKLDAAGNKSWDRSYGGAGVDLASTIIQTADGGYLVSASSDSRPGGNKKAPLIGRRDAWLIRLNANGDKLWERTLGTPGDDALTFAAPLPNGQFLLSGYAGVPKRGPKAIKNFGGTDGWAVLINTDGTTAWERRYGAASTDALTAGAMLAGGEFVLAGFSQLPTAGNSDYWFLRIDAAGRKLWERKLGGSAPGLSQVADVKQTSDDGFILAGDSFNGIGRDKTVPALGAGDGWVIKFLPEPDDCDNDGVLDYLDQCPNTPAGQSVNVRGCSPSQLDTDLDGVTDPLDQYPNTPGGEAVNAQGAGISQLCPCNGPWTSHTAYVSCVTKTASTFRRAKLISSADQMRITRAASRSTCGNR